MQRFAWEPFLVRDRSVNAFALPGGYVGVHLGADQPSPSTADELASVLAHELSHVTQRHIARSVTTSQRQTLCWSLAGADPRRAGGAQQQPDAAQAAMLGGQAAAMQGQLNFSRDMEREADRIGLSVMNTAGFAPPGMAACSRSCDHANRLNDNGAYPYLRTHPLTTERIAEAQARLGTGAVAATRVARPEHALMQARARVLMDKRVDALRRWQGRDADSEGSAADKLLTSTKAPRRRACCATGRGRRRLRQGAGDHRTSPRTAASGPSGRWR